MPVCDGNMERIDKTADKIEESVNDAECDQRPYNFRHGRILKIGKELRKRPDADKQNRINQHKEP